MGLQGLIQASLSSLTSSLMLKQQHMPCDCTPSTLPVSTTWKATWLTSLQKRQWLGESLLLLSHFSRVRLCATPQMAGQQAPPSQGFSRQEHWSGLPFPSPMQESEQWKWSRSVATAWTAAYQAPPPMGFFRQEFWSGVPSPSPGGGSRKPVFFQNTFTQMRTFWKTLKYTINC